jgi:sugar phosphate permease
MQKRKKLGLSSGIVNTSYQSGSSLGLAIMVAIPCAQTLVDENSGISLIDALNNSFHLAFTTVAIVSAIVAIVAFVYTEKPNTPGGRRWSQ